MREPSIRFCGDSVTSEKFPGTHDPNYQTLAAVDGDAFGADKKAGEAGGPGAPKPPAAGGMAGPSNRFYDRRPSNSSFQERTTPTIRRSLPLVATRSALTRRPRREAVEALPSPPRRAEWQVAVILTTVTASVV